MSRPQGPPRRKGRPGRPRKAERYGALSARQYRALITACMEGRLVTDRREPTGIYRSLIVRGLVDGDERITPAGRAAVAGCPMLSRHFRETLTARGELT